MVSLYFEISNRITTLKLKITSWHVFVMIASRNSICWMIFAWHFPISAFNLSQDKWRLLRLQKNLQYLWNCKYVKSFDRIFILFRFISVKILCEFNFFTVLKTSPEESTVLENMIIVVILIRIYYSKVCLLISWGTYPEYKDYQ